MSYVALDDVSPASDTPGNSAVVPNRGRRRFFCEGTTPLPAQPVDALMIHSARRQHTATADKIAARILNCAHAVRQDLAAARPAGPAARQLAADAQALLEALAELRAVEKFAAWTRQPAA